MALINCPECGKEISDQAESCPNCGYPIQTKLNEALQPQPVEVTGVKLRKLDKKKKIILFSILGLLLIAIVASFSIYTFNQQKQAQAAKMATTKTSETYHDNLLLLEVDMYAGANRSENLCDLIGQVWYNTIYQKDDPTTDKYTKSTEYSFNSDFNTSLQKLFEDQDTKNTISEIESNQTNVASLMKQMLNPPKEYQQAYETLEKLYTSYQGLTDLAINPSGNLTTFSADKTSKVEDFITLYKTLDTQVPNKEESSIPSSVSSK